MNRRSFIKKVGFLVIGIPLTGVKLSALVTTTTIVNTTSFMRRTGTGFTGSTTTTITLPPSHWYYPKLPYQRLP